MSDSSSSSHCPQCGGTTPGAPEGLCPRCLMAQVMQPTQTGGLAGAMPPFKPEEIAPHFPQLEILECLGRGGMGVVYKARQKSLNRLVALKLLAPERADDPQFAARFEKEAHALAALNHPHIVGVHDFGQAGGFYYLLMEFVDGVNLRQLLETKRLTPKEALSIVPPVCDALQCAHDHGIVHRDIKPENLLIDKTGKVKIADFGVAKMLGAAPLNTSTTSPAHDTVSQAFGTPDYAAPEQANGQTDHRADIYSLGVVLYEMLTGERPQEQIVPPSKRVQVDIRIDEVVLRALEKTPGLRFATAAEFRTQVEAVTQQVPPPAAHTAPPPGAGWGRLLGKMFGVTTTASPSALKLRLRRILLPVPFILAPVLVVLGWLMTSRQEHPVVAQQASLARESPPAADGRKPAPRALEMRWVDESSSARTEALEMQGAENAKRPAERWNVEKRILLDETDVKLVGVLTSEASDQPGAMRIHLTLTREGALKFAQLTAEGKGRRLAIILSGRLYAAPIIRESITGGYLEISGNFTKAEATNLAHAIWLAIHPAAPSTSSTAP